MQKENFASDSFQYSESLKELEIATLTFVADYFVIALLSQRVF